MTRLTFALPLLAAALAASAAGAANYPGNQGKTWADIAKLPQITGIYEAPSRRIAGPDGQRDIPPVFTAKAAADLAAYKAKKIEDTDAANCLPPGMPRIMAWPY